MPKLGRDVALANRELATEKRRLKVAELYLSGVTTLTDLARQAGCSYPTIFSDMKAIREQWRQERIDAFDYFKDCALKEYDHIKKAAWLEWERSKLPAEKKVTSTTENDAGGSSSVTETEEGQCGNPQYLMVILRAGERRDKLLGLEDPIQVNVKGQIAVAAVQLQKIVENNGEFIEYQRQQLLSLGSNVPSLLCDGVQPELVAASEASAYARHLTGEDGDMSAVVTESEIPGSDNRTGRRKPAKANKKTIRRNASKTRKVRAR